MLLLNLEEEHYLPTLRTFLAVDTLKVIQARKFTEDETADWSNIVRPTLITLLDTAVVTNKDVLKKEFLKAKQQQSESIASYGSRLKQLHLEAFGTSQSEDLLKTVFENGLQNKNLAIHLSMWQLDDPKKTFADILT